MQGHIDGTLSSFDDLMSPVARSEQVHDVMFHPSVRVPRSDSPRKTLGEASPPEVFMHSTSSLEQPLNENMQDPACISTGLFGLKTPVEIQAVFLIPYDREKAAQRRPKVLTRNARPFPLLLSLLHPGSFSFFLSGKDEQMSPHESHMSPHESYMSAT